jgi:hypothetical protein
MRLFASILFGRAATTNEARGLLSVDTFRVLPLLTTFTKTDHIPACTTEPQRLHHVSSSRKRFAQLVNSVNLLELEHEALAEICKLCQRLCRIVSEPVPLLETARC